MTRGRRGSHQVVGDQLRAVAAPVRRHAPAPSAQTVSLNGNPFSVVGVAPPGFQGTTVIRADAWVPISAMATWPRRGAVRRCLTSREGGVADHGRTAEARRKVAQANAELDAIGVGLGQEFPDANRGKGLTAARLGGDSWGHRHRSRDSSPADRDRVPGAARRLRESLGDDAGARGLPAARDCGAAGHRRWPDAARAAALHRDASSSSLAVRPGCC